jgi:hypothetical protein
MPRRDPERIDLGAIKTDRTGHAVPQGASFQAALHDDRECRDRYRLDRAFLATLPMKVNLARGLCRAWLVGSLLWIIYWSWRYYKYCHHDFSEYFLCYFGGGPSTYYTNERFYTELLEFVIGTPVLVFLLGAVALCVGRWIAKGFRPSDVGW